MKTIETTFTDAHGGQAEIEKHTVEATQTLGANPLLVSSKTEGVLNKERTETTGYKLTTQWQTRGPTTTAG